MSGLIVKEHSGVPANGLAQATEEPQSGGGPQPQVKNLGVTSSVNYISWQTGVQQKA